MALRASTEILVAGGREQAGVDPGPQDHQHHAVPLGSQELERIPDVLRRFRTAAAWRTTTAQDS
jgi:hypothetical protein